MVKMGFGKVIDAILSRPSHSPNLNAFENCCGKRKEKLRKQTVRKNDDL